jgi:hypothetical protein
MLIFELPALLLVLRWYRRGSAIAVAVLTGILAFFTYYYVSMVFGTAQNRLFPLYVAAASIAGFALSLSHRGSTSTTSLPPCQRRPNAKPWRRISSRWRQRSRWPGCPE